MPTKKILVTVKTYPTPAKKGIEVSCIAGVTSEAQWIRLFPLPFRFLPDDKRFKKYQWIKASLTKAPDPRPESHMIDVESIEILGEPLSSENCWQSRKAIIMPLAAPSLCHLIETRKQTGATLGIFKPKEITEFIVESDPQPTWSSKELEILSQESLFYKKPLTPLEKIPYRFIYKFVCNKSGCKGHRLSVVDWEIDQAYRSWKRKYGTQWEKYFRQRFEDEMISKFDTHFFAGTMRSHPDIWIIIGLFYPPL
jgi:hypothetical protein